MTIGPDSTAPDPRLDPPSPEVLADFVAGELKSDLARQIEMLITSDVEWQRAYAALTAAQDRVRGALADQEQLRLPESVAARLHASIAAAQATRSARPMPALSSRPASARPPRSGPHHDSRPASPRPGRRRTSGRRISLRALSAAALVLVLSLGAALFLLRPGVPSSTSGGALDQASAERLPTVAGPQLAVTKRDYNRTTLREALALLGGANAGASGTSSPQAPGTKSPTFAVPLTGQLSAGSAELTKKVDPGLVRLTEPAALAACLAAVGELHPGPVVLADFATYEGAPALIVVVFGQPSTVVAVGAKCGVSGADSLAVA